MSRRVDALVLGFKVDLLPNVRNDLEERQALADLARRAEVRVGDFVFSMARSRRRGFFAFENGDLRGTFDDGAGHAWGLEIVVRATFLQTHALGEAVALAQQVASAFGRIDGVRLRRFDLAADYMGFPLRWEDADRIATKRAKVQTFVVTGDDASSGEGTDDATAEPAVVHLDSMMRVTGFTVAPGNPLMGRLYDKTAELRLPGREAKRAREHALWIAGGWDEAAPVTRVEFQHRGVFLDEVDLRDPLELEGKLDEIWQGDVLWLRIVDPSTATRRTRCKLDPRWVAVTETVFVHPSIAGERVRERGGARPGLVVGSAMSMIAGAGRLNRIDLGLDKEGKPLDENAFVESKTDEELRRWLGDEVERLFEKVPSFTVRAALDVWGPREAVRRYLAKYNGLIAKFSSSNAASPSPEPTGGQ